MLRGRLKRDVPAVNRMENVLLGILHDRPARLAAIVFVEVGAQAARALHQGRLDTLRAAACSRREHGS